MPYRVLTGMDYPPDRRAEIGDIVDDIPKASIKWLIADGHIEEVDAKGKPVQPTADATEEAGA